MIKSILTFPLRLFCQIFESVPRYGVTTRDGRVCAQAGIIGAIIGAGASLLGASKSSKASKSAARAQTKATNKAIKESRRQFDVARKDEREYIDQAREDATPWRKAGRNAVTQLRIMSGLVKPWHEDYDEFNDPFKYKHDPGYRFRQKEGKKAIERSAAARGNLLSGRTLKAAGRWAQDYASNEYGRAYDRHMQDKAFRRNTLASMAGYGPMPSPAPSTGATIQHGNNLAELYAQGGNARAAGIVGGANAWSSGIGAAGNSIGQYYQLQDLLGSGGSSSGGSSSGGHTYYTRPR